MNAPAGMGFWPFDSEKEKNLQNAVEAAAVKLSDEVWPKLSATQKATWLLKQGKTGVPKAFLLDYMRVERAVGRPYTSNTDYYTVWQPRLKAYGWDEDTLDKLMFALRTLNASGYIPREVIDPAHNEAPGDDQGPLGDLGDALSKGFTRVALITAGGVVAYFLVKGFVTGSIRPGRNR